MKVSWDDEIPNTWKVIKHVPNHQPGGYPYATWDGRNPAPPWIVEFL